MYLVYDVRYTNWLSSRPLLLRPRGKVCSGLIVAYTQKWIRFRLASIKFIRSSREFHYWDSEWILLNGKDSWAGKTIIRSFPAALWRLVINTCIHNVACPGNHRFPFHKLSNEYQMQGNLRWSHERFKNRISVDVAMKIGLSYCKLHNTEDDTIGFR